MHRPSFRWIDGSNIITEQLPEFEDIKKLFESSALCAEHNPVSLTKSCNEVGLDRSKIYFETHFDFSQSISSFDEHTLQTLGNATHRGREGSLIDVTHEIKIDRSLKGTLQGQHTLYHELAHCAVFEQEHFWSRDLDRAWNEAFAELLATLAVLLRNGPNDHSRRLWASYLDFKARGGAIAALNSYRNDRVVSASEAHDMCYERLRWVLFEAVALHRRFGARLDNLLTELILTNGNSDVWLPPSVAAATTVAAAAAATAAAPGRKRTRSSTTEPRSACPSDSAVSKKPRPPPPEDVIDLTGDDSDPPSPPRAHPTRMQGLTQPAAPGMTASRSASTPITSAATAAAIKTAVAAAAAAASPIPQPASSAGLPLRLTPTTVHPLAQHAPAVAAAAAPLSRPATAGPPLKRPAAAANHIQRPATAVPPIPPSRPSASAASLPRPAAAAASAAATAAAAAGRRDPGRELRSAAAEARRQALAAKGQPQAQSAAQSRRPALSGPVASSAAADPAHARQGGAGRHPPGPGNQGTRARGEAGAGGDLRGAAAAPGRGQTQACVSVGARDWAGADGGGAMAFLAGTAAAAARVWKLVF
jgi:hypothetical protein